MSENLENSNGVNPGKSLGVTGFVISLVMLFFGFILSGLFALWFGASGPMVILLIAVLGLILSIVGMKKSKKAGFKNPLGLTGMIISIVVLATWLIMILFIGTAVSAVGDTDEWKDAMEQLDDNDEWKDAMKQLDELDESN